MLSIIALSVKLFFNVALRAAQDGGANGRVVDLLIDPALRRLFLAMDVLTVGWDVYNFPIPVHGMYIDLSASQIGIVMDAFAEATFIMRRMHPWVC